MEWEDTFVSVFLKDNPQLLFSMCGFDPRILPKIRTMSGERFSLKDAVWNLTNEQMKKRAAQAFLCVSDDGCPTIQQPYSSSPHQFQLHDFLKDC